MGERKDVWKRLEQAKPTGLERLSIAASPVFAPGDLEWDRFTVVTGNHGAGKSYLLRTLTAAFPERPKLKPTGPPYEVDSLRAEAMTGRYVLHHRARGATTWEADLGKPSEERLSGSVLTQESPLPFGEYLDAGSAFETDYYWAFDSSSYFDEETKKHLTEGPFPFSAEEARALRAITGRHYDELRWYSFQAEEGLFVPLPEGVIDGQVVTAARMSRGELWVHFLLYHLRRAPAGSTIVIDEPETYLSPIGHVALIDELARRTLAHGVQTIIATHSTAMISRVPPAMLRVLTPGPDGTRVIRPVSTGAALHTVGHRIPVSGVIFVEDEVAKRMVTAALARLDRTLAEQVDVVAAKGAGEALAGARVLNRSRTLRVCALLDGDQRGNLGTGHDFPVAVLPGESPDDELLRRVRADPRALAELLDQCVDDVVLSLDRARFVPHQFWWTGAARLLGVDEDVLIGHVVRIWLRDSEVQQELRLVFADLRERWSRAIRLRK
ncbi:AAA domain-containing protein, putative AbiEii toxin, Type IV TA system [Amycolatopsis pretoriensis]|uniref:AAA domain-containing protein, putative AbiEii toxin, Type IV TA system n=1 Tax=Amycolatopsis pretoriensis TaxID=218821 RepID=A0A1H5R216_9PSEU|nr:AAA family ATPase [Amycolatopsis pretoriensis]SEF32442.1 AAA domain-containing protein, putative AbiEii toxin, Type IV TA system [Amycolatopsis pretoriensis]